MVSNKYGDAALEAVKLLNITKSLNPEEAWDIVTQKIFGKDTPAQKKRCPQNTFLAICETGKIKGVMRGTYTKSRKNKNYALKAIKILEKNPELSANKKDLWHLIPECENKTHNNQMDVVVSLWNSDYWLK